MCNIEMSQTISDELTELAYYVLQFVKKQDAWPSNIGYNVKRKHSDIEIIL